jgi:vacuolar protein sorting-associated protein 35
MTAEDMLALYVSLLNLSLKVYPDKLEYVDQVFNNTTSLLAKLKEDGCAHTAFHAHVSR